jgi:hypothetical protein
LGESRLDSASLLAVLLAAIFQPAALAQESIKPSAGGIEFFESRIRPVLVKNCYMCHSRQFKTAQGGLVLDSREAIRSGGQSGHAVMPGNIEESLILSALRHDGKLKMPPMGKLPDAVIADFVEWVRMGAPDPREEQAGPVYAPIDLEKGRKFWAFQPPQSTKPPAIRHAGWARSSLDRYIVANLERKGLTPVPEADRRTLIRRASYDLTGLPPTPAEVDAFLADKGRNAFEKVIDRLLASPRFGERWGRHWLDIARYAETMGRTRNYPFPVAWRYRDYVIDSFNQDKPYDQFVREQIAGDLLPYQSPEQRNRQLIATAFLALGAHDLNENDRKLAAMDAIDEQINVTTRSILALTVGCARCHDHKFDPIPTRDYYALAGIFRSTEMRNGMRQRPQFNGTYFNPELLLTLDGIAPHAGSDSEEIENKRKDLTRQLLAAERARDRFEVRRISRALGDLPVPQNLAMGVEDAAKKSDCEINIRGDAHSLGERVPRGFVQVLYAAGADLPAIPGSDSGRLQLADWLTRRENPLTARVMANRVWQHLMGRGIVETVDNFGKSGGLPSNQELLDHLALRLMDQGWSVKKLIREIMLSRTYQLSGDFHARNFQADPGNKLFWRMSRQRLEVESIRDSMLMISGQLKLDPPAGSPVQHWPMAGEAGRGGGGRIQPWELKETYRSIYIPVVRNAVNRFYETFDFPEPSETKGERDVTTVAPQALFLMNSQFVIDQARIASERLLAAEPGDEARVRRAYLQVFSRDATAAEVQRALAYIGRAMESGASELSEGVRRHDAWTRFIQALFASAEFRYRG